MAIRQDERGILRWVPWERYRWLQHGFTTVYSAEGAWGREPGVERLVELRQTHSISVLDAFEVPAAGELLIGDALIGAKAGEILTVRTADCMPVLVVDPIRRVAGVAHAGWRGMAGGIVANLVAEMQRRYRSRPQDCEALLGPSIRAENFEVGEEVAVEFAPDSIVRKPEWPRPHVDLAQAAKTQLAQSGLSPERVFDVGLCTYAHPELFPSYRRDGDQCGRLVAAVGIV